MHSLWLWAALTISASPAAVPLEDGTLVFLENCNSIVELSTGGQIGHVALAFRDGQDAYLYEATPAKVRRVKLEEYYAELARLNRRRDADEQIRVWALRPLTAYSPAETAKMREFLDAQIGRRYSVENYVKGRPGEGVHCAELASTTLTKSGRHAFEGFHKIHPQALFEAAKATHAPPEEIALDSPAVKETWCVRANRRWGEYWTLCGWSCREAWAWCW